MLIGIEFPSYRAYLKNKKKQPILALYFQLNIIYNHRECLFYSEELLSSLIIMPEK